MKVNIETDQALLETEVLIRCAAHDERIDSIIAALHRSRWVTQTRFVVES